MSMFDIGFIDFDSTLFYSSQFSKDIRFVLSNAVQNSSILAASMEEAVRGVDGDYLDYTFEKHIAILKNKYKIAVSEKIIEDLIQLVKKNNYTFADAAFVLEELKKNTNTLILLSAGNATFQMMKLKASGLEKYFDDIIFVHNGKEKVIKNMLKNKERCYFINDNLQENSLVLKHCPEVLLVTKSNKEKYSEKDLSKLGNPFFDSLTEIKNYVLQQ